MTLSHGPIPSIKWGTMTMDFKLPPGGAPARAEAGRPINFEFYMDAKATAPDSRRSRGPSPRRRRANMIARLIRWSIVNRFLVLLATVMVSAWGVYAVLRTPLDALPDLSDVQVIIRTTYPGPGAAHRREPGHLPADHDDAVGAGRQDGARLFVLRRLVRVRAVRGRHRSVLGALARARVPEPGAVTAARRARRPSLGPDATGVGWIYQYALVDRSGTQDARQLRALQDWFLRYELKTVPNVAEVASIGGMVRQYQVVLDPDRLAAYNIPHTQGGRGDQQGEPGNRRLGARAGRGRVHGARIAAICRRWTISARFR